jgi:aminobenzoyl-glutamate utilization protein B
MHTAAPSRGDLEETMKTKQDVSEWLEENRQQFIGMANAIWEKPEIAFHEFFASKLQADFLEQQGFKVKRDIAGMNTAFTAEWGTGKPIIGFAGEYDALPGLSQKCQPTKEALVDDGMGQGCGHNLLGTAHVAAVVALKQWMQANAIPGTLRYYGCPAEEAGAAKTYMARAGLYDDLDAAFNFHPMYANAAMKGSMVGVNSMKFRFHGKTAHAGAAPHLGRSALDGVELMNVGVNYLREHVTSDVRMHYTITQGGGAPNVVPAEAEVYYMLRAHQPENLRDVTGRVGKIAEGAAMMTGTQVEEIFVAAMSNVLSNHVLADLQYENMQVIGPIQWTPEELAFAQKVNEGYPPGTAEANAEAFNMPPSLLTQAVLSENYPAYDEGKVLTGSTDVGDMSWRVPLSMLMTSCWTTASVGHSWGIVATSRMSIGHKGMLHAAKIMALSAMDLFSDPQHIRRVRAEFERELAAHPYVNPIPEHIQPPRFSREE